MTDNEIIKALEICYRTGEDCKNCPFYDVVDCCDNLVGDYTLDLINRQKAEIEKLRENNKAIMQTIAGVHTEAIKEFAERLKEKGNRSLGDYFIVKWIDDLVKEMVGDV